MDILIINNFYKMNVFDLDETLDAIKAKFNYNRLVYPDLSEYIIKRIPDVRIEFRLEKKEFSGFIEGYTQTYQEYYNYEEGDIQEVYKDSYGISTEEVLNLGISPREFVATHAYGNIEIKKCISSTTHTL